MTVYEGCSRSDLSKHRLQKVRCVHSMCLPSLRPKEELVLALQNWPRCKEKGDGPTQKPSEKEQVNRTHCSEASELTLEQAFPESYSLPPVAAAGTSHKHLHTSYPPTGRDDDNPYLSSRAFKEPATVCREKRHGSAKNHVTPGREP